MIIWLAELLQPYFSFFRLFEYLSFRAIVSVLTALGISLWMGPRMIRRLQMLQIGQVVRNEGPESHFSKRGTPTMGDHDPDCNCDDRFTLDRSFQSLRLGGAGCPDWLWCCGLC